MELFKLLGTISIDTGQANEAIEEVIHDRRYTERGDFITWNYSAY